MRTLAVRLAILGLIWVLTPGLTEAAENVWHLVVAGHGAHALEAGPEHAPDDEEHGCSGTFHLCSCHVSPTSTLTSRIAVAAPPVVDPQPQLTIHHPESPLLPELFRPPRS